MRRVYLRPSLNDGEDFGGCEVRECEVVRGRKGYYVAFACNGVCAEEEVREIYVFAVVSTGCDAGKSGLTFRITICFVLSLLFLHGTVIIDEYKCAFIFRIGIALRALVSRAEIALKSSSGELSSQVDRIPYRWIVLWECNL